MKPLQFTEEIATGDVAIDSDHQQLIELAKQLREFDSKVDPKKVTAALINLAGITARHFDSEDALMEETNYPRIEGMRLQHQRLLNEVDVVLTAWKQEKSISGISSMIYYLLTDWFFQHIIEWDRDLAIHARTTRNTAVPKP